MSFDSALRGDTYRTLVRSGSSPPAAIASATSRSSAHRNAARVLPEPVGAVQRTSLPAAIRGQACACAGVGAPNFRSSQVATTG